LGASAGHILGDGVDISDDGEAVVGVWRFQNPGGLEHTRAFRWRATTGYQFMQPAAGHTYTSATAASGNASVIVGSSANSNFSGFVGGHWPSGTAYSATGTGTLFDVSASGAAAAGVDSNFTVQSRAVRWTSGGAQDLGVLAGTNQSIAYGITRDGTRVVGGSNIGPFGGAGTGRAFMWSSAGMQDLGGLAGASRTTLYRVNDAATMGIGFANFDSPTQSGVNVPIIWRAGAGFMTAQSFIASLGLSTGGLSMTELTAISADGTIITGYGQRPIPGGFRVDGFVITVPAPAGVAVVAVGLVVALRRRR
jgi:uncharacterized membrane protein